VGTVLFVDASCTISRLLTMALSVITSPAIVPDGPKHTAIIPVARTLNPIDLEHRRFVVFTIPPSPSR
jgi:hypothetical protein